MLMSLVLLPDALTGAHFADKAFRQNAESLLRGVTANGVFVCDSGGRLYTDLCDRFEALSSIPKAKTAQVLFEELLKLRKKTIRFCDVDCPGPDGRPTTELACQAAHLARADSLVIGQDPPAAWPPNRPGNLPILALSDYSDSQVEIQRRRYYEGLPTIDKMTADELTRLIGRSTRFARWIRVYDKQIGKAGNLSGFRRGLERIVRSWVTATHHPRDQLKVEIYTVADESSYKEIEPTVAYHRVHADLVQRLRDTFGINVELFFKRDMTPSITHDRYLQTPSLAMSFGQGFDFIDSNDLPRRTTIKLEGAVTEHLKEYRGLADYPIPKGN